MSIDYLRGFHSSSIIILMRGMSKKFLCPAVLFGSLFISSCLVGSTYVCVISFLFRLRGCYNPCIFFCPWGDIQLSCLSMGGLSLTKVIGLTLSCSLEILLGII